MSLNHVMAVCLATMLLLTGCVTPEDELEEKNDKDLTTANESEENILGCTYESADNFQSNATVDDGSCLFEDSLEAEYNEGYDDGYDDGGGNDYYWDCPDSATAIEYGLIAAEAPGGGGGKEPIREAAGDHNSSRSNTTSIKSGGGGSTTGLKSTLGLIKSGFILASPSQFRLLAAEKALFRHISEGIQIL